MSAQSIFLSMSAIQQHQLTLLCSVFLTQFFLTQIFSFIFLLFFCSVSIILVFEILIRFTITNSYSVLCCAFVEKFSVCFVSHHICLLVWDFSQAFCYELLFNLVQHFQKRSLFALSNFRSTNFSSICIQCVRVSLTNLIDKDLISSVNQIQLKTDNQF